MAAVLGPAAGPQKELSALLCQEYVNVPVPPLIAPPVKVVLVPVQIDIDEPLVFPAIAGVTVIVPVAFTFPQPPVRGML